MAYPKEILDFFQDIDGLDIKKRDNIAVINPGDFSLIELMHKDFDNIFLLSEDEPLINEAARKYPKIRIIKGNALQTGFEDKFLSNIFIDKMALSYDADKMRIEFRRILENYWCDLVIFEDKTESGQNKNIPPKFLEDIFAGSWYEKKEFHYSENKSTTLYWNPPGFNNEELHSKEIFEFVKACENYCSIIENYSKFTVREFLVNTLRALTEYYYKAFSLPESCGSDNTSESYDIYDKKDVNKFFEMLNLLCNFLGKQDMYLSNYDPSTEDGEKETFEQSLSCDLAEIYEDIKANLNVFENGNLYDKQQTLWQWKFDWRGHTGDHVTFAFRAIHWKHGDLEFDDDNSS